MSSSKEIIRLGTIEINFLLEGKDTNGQVAMFEFKVPVGAKVPIPHYHEAYDETVYGLEGILTFIVEGKVTEVHPGESLFIPKGANHGFNNLYKADAKALTVITPALIGPDFFKEVAGLLSAGGPPDIEKLKAVYAKWGLKPSIP
ncbi:MAG: cupin domain-containing protein [Sphingobacteriales bacterium]|nr:cupin domain-containing protein [Sphingobacteriales bacterium]